jgi:hypothetical protein
MTEEEFAQLPPEQQQALMQQMQQSQAMKIGYGSMDDPYSQDGGQQFSAAKEAQGGEAPMPAMQGQMSGIDPAAGNALGKAIAKKRTPDFNPAMAPESLAVGGDNTPVAQVGGKSIMEKLKELWK